jgi:hypothetical protein
MPPAFNLSQDQTLQFNSQLIPYCTLALPQSPTPNQSLPRSPQRRPFLTCEHSIFVWCLPHPQFQHHPRLNPQATPSPKTQQTLISKSSTHTYRLLIVKEQVLRGALLLHPRSTKPRIIQTEKDRSSAFANYIASPHEPVCNQATVTRANLRLPTCATTVQPRATFNVLSLIFCPSSFTPP